MPRIFISYRRADSITVTGRLHDHLVRAFGADNVFKDVDDIPLGADFRRVLQREVGDCDVQLVIIGPQWLTLTDERGRRRIENPDDFVHVEVAAGLARSDVLVIPVLVSGATMPGSADLPPDLVELAYRNAAIIRDDPDFVRDAGRLIDQIRAAVAPAQHHAPVEVQSPVTARSSTAGGPAAVSPPRSAPRAEMAPAGVRARSASSALPRPAPAEQPGRPWGRWLLALLAVAVVVGGGVWLAANSGFLENAIDLLGGGSEGSSIRPPTNLEGARSLSCGEQVTGILTDDDWKDEWLLEAEPGQPYLISMNRLPGRTTLDPLLIIHNAQGVEQAADDNGGADNNARLLVMSLDSGRHIITATRARIAEGDSSGEYTLSVACNVTPVACGGVVEGYLGPEAPENVWGFTADAGTLIRATVRVNASRYIPLNLHTELISPNDIPIGGSEQVDDFTYVVQARGDKTGLYVLVIRLEEALQQQVQQVPAGDYSLELACE